FAGTTRRFTGEKETDRLFYEAHNSMALKEMRALVSRATETWPVLKAVLLHRTGEVAVGQASVIVGVTTPHRDDAFLASRFLIDELKKSVQIWKKEVYRNGSTEWVETDWES
ncbi:MAG: molybdenum cofactor biosynthesis protein MoaE, partial [Bacteroidetes Order II. Incertae sedis bacterium]|nr:molybdenum cofactor biosynthesis protein MoaE [Bacteroidetes Order II. bacterium]